MADITVGGVKYAPVSGNSLPGVCSSCPPPLAPAEGKQEAKALVLTQLKPQPRALAAVLYASEPSMRKLVLKSAGFTGKGNGPAVVKVRLPITPQAVSSNGVGQVQVVYGIQYTSVAGISDWANVFKEYRFTTAEIVFIPCGCPVLSAADASFGAGINYSTNITAPGSLSEVLSLDQGKVVGLGLTKISKWHCDFTKIFGEVWADTGTNVVYGTWKAFNTATGNPLSVQLGNWCGHVDVEFRGLG